MKKFVLVLLAFALTSCAMLAQSDLDRNKGKWEEAGITHYRFKLFIGCFCPFGQDMPLIIEVKD